MTTHCLFLYVSRIVFIHLSTLCMAEPSQTLSCLYTACIMSLDFHWDHLWEKAVYILDKGIKYSETVRCKVLCQGTFFLLLELLLKDSSAPLGPKLQDALLPLWTHCTE